MCELAEHLTLYILDRNDINKFYDANPWLNKEVFSAICSLYGYPDNNTLTVVIENYYIDAAYRDVYYNYWAKLHFDWNRYSRRILLFKNAHSENEFYEKEYVSTLNKDFLGTMVVRSSYSNETDHTLGRTLLNPYKMVKYDEKGKTVKPFIYLTTAEYKVHLLGNIYVVPAFPFSSQDGVVMRCAETTVQVLCDYASAISPHYARVLPSDIQEKLKHRVSERILPSHGLYCNDISYLLREFKFSPLIYASSEGFDNIKFLETNDLKKGLISNINTDKNEDIDVKTWDNQHTTDFKDWLHYYVESAVPVLIITAPNQEVNKHAALIIGHGKDRRPLDKCRLFKLGNFPCVDTAEFYESYIIQDDNQIPYVEEKMDEFTRKKDYKLEAYIVPLERHVFLEAGSAVNICDAFIEQQKDLLEEAVKAIIEQAEIQAKEDKENRKSYLNIVNAMNISEPVPSIKRIEFTIAIILLKRSFMHQH